MATAAAPFRRSDEASVRRRLLRPYVLLLAAAAVVLGLGADHDALVDKPVLFALLAAAFVALHWPSADLLGSGHTSPTTVPSIAIALLFGPAGVLAAELVVTLYRFRERPGLIRQVFDLGALGLSGMAAWAVAQALPGDGPAVLLTGLAAGVAYFAVNSSLLVVVWYLAEGRTPRTSWRSRLVPGMFSELACGPVAVLFVLAEAKVGVAALGLIAAPLAALWAGEKQGAAQAQRSVAELVESLARIIEARDPYTAGHTERVVHFAQVIAARLGFAKGDLRAVAVGAVIHDIGKIGTPDDVLLKQGPLDAAEWEIMRRHPQTGSYILEAVEVPTLAKQMARHHHERFDGGGYPDRLAGEEIPLAARVLTVADALDAMTSDRPYRNALPMQVALDELEAKAGSQFCPCAVAAALAAAAAGELTSAGTP